MKEKLSIQKRVNLKLIDMVYKQITYAQWGEAIIFTITAILLWDKTNNTLLLIWYISSMIFFIIRYLGAVYYECSKSKSDSKKWVFLLCVSVFIGGSSWAPLGSILTLNLSPTMQIFLLYLFLTATTVANIFLSPAKYIYIFFIVPAYFTRIIFIFFYSEIYIGEIIIAASHIALNLALSYYINKYMEGSIKIQFKNEELSSEIISTARQAGMADVATSVLHNIGNTLNSVNVSINLLYEKLQHSRLLNGFVEVNHQLKNHIQDLNTYLTEDKQGKNLLPYFDLLENMVQQERTEATEEFKRLIDNIQRIKEILLMQQSMVNVLTIIELVSISEQIDASIKMIGFDSSYVIERDYAFNQPVLVDKIKLLQILINLITNSKDALTERNEAEKKIILTIVLMPNNFVQVRVIDNGIGINPDNLNQVFSFGFTTKKGGAGFGLHTSALLAQEMGGSLKVISEGHNKGATFIFEFPYKKREGQ